MNGTAHVTFVGGGIVQPARDPYDHELFPTRRRQVRSLVSERLHLLAPARPRL